MSLSKPVLTSRAPISPHPPLIYWFGRAGLLIQKPLLLRRHPWAPIKGRLVEPIEFPPLLLQSGWGRGWRDCPPGATFTGEILTGCMEIGLTLIGAIPTDRLCLLNPFIAIFPKTKSPMTVGKSSYDHRASGNSEIGYRQYPKTEINSLFFL